MNYTSCTRDYESCDDAKGVCIVSTGHKLGLCVPACTQAAYANCYAKQKLKLGVATVVSVCEGAICKAVPDAVDADCTLGQVCDVKSANVNDFGECVSTLVQGKVCAGPTCDRDKPCWFSRTQRGLCTGPTPNVQTCELPCAKPGDRCTGHAPTGTQFFSGVCDANNACVDQCPKNAADGAPCFLRIDSTSKDGTCDASYGYCAPPKCARAGESCFDSTTSTNGTCGVAGDGRMSCVSPAAIASQRLGGSCTYLEANFTAIAGWVTGVGELRVCARKPECICIGGSCVNGVCDAAMPVVVTTTTAAKTTKTTTAGASTTAGATTAQSSDSTALMVETSATLIVACAFAVTCFQ